MVHVVHGDGPEQGHHFNALLLEQCRARQAYHTSDEFKYGVPIKWSIKYLQ